VQILKYIEGYSWQKHLANENRKVIEEAVEPTTEERVEHLEMSPVSVATPEKRAWYHVLAGWFCNLFKRFK
jgi:hypothetical protein